MLGVATAGPSAYWYLSRATGAVALVLLTLSVVLGVLGPLRFAGTPRWPRFAIGTLHRDVSLLVIVMLIAHIVVSVLDSFAPIRLVDGVIPFGGVYRPLWLGLGALSFDLLLALVATSLLRRHLGYRSWRTVHWLAYASWPIAVLHGLGTGSDAKQLWMLGLTVVCLAAVLGAVVARVTRAELPGEARAGWLAAAVAVPLGMGVFALLGPLQHGWARRAGTPTHLLASARSAPSARAASPARVRVSISQPFTARLTGTLRQRAESGGAVIQLSMRMSGGMNGVLRIRLGGIPADGGGLSLSGSQVDLAAPGMPVAMEGKVTSLDGGQLAARVRGAHGSALNLQASLNIDNASRSVTGVVRGEPAA